MDQKLILIMCTYYNRPILVRNALNSIIKANVYHSNWKLAFGDDASPIPGEPIVREILAHHLDKVDFYREEKTLQEKIDGGISLGKAANEVLRNTDAEIVVTLNDDDELHPKYLANLNYFMSHHPEVLYCYSNIHLYNPLLQNSEDVDNITGPYNQYTEPINCYGKCDGSQVAWRISCNKEYDAWFPDSTIEGNKEMPWVTNTDAEFFDILYKKCGPAFYSGFVSQYKGIHDYQLLWYKKANVEGLKKYMRNVDNLAGDKF